MKLPQIYAGQEPPVMPCPPDGWRVGRQGWVEPEHEVFISIWASGYPTHTLVTRFGVYPTNHASRYSWAVPVLPAAGRPMFPYAAAVPRWMTCSRAVVAR